MQTDAIGVLGGSGLYELNGLLELREIPVTTPWGEPSAPPVEGRFAGRRVVFMPRHGRGHRLLPSEINYRANICALKQLGVAQVISISAVGSMREEIQPGDFVLADQFIDRTVLRASTFFGGGCVGHVSFADPVCADLVGAVARGAEQAGFAPRRAGALEEAVGGVRPRLVHIGGTYVCMEGPQFSTRAESLLHRSWNAAVIGMTGATEAKLCREAELCFALVALATDYDCWHTEEQSVTAGMVLQMLRDNIAAAKEMLTKTLPGLPTDRRCGCMRAAEHALLTAPDAIAPAARARLQELYGRKIG